MKSLSLIFLFLVVISCAGEVEKIDGLRPEVLTGLRKKQQTQCIKDKNDDL